jgi:protein-S-isoprenylcysteine O-methyltransferase Ste14
MVFRLLATVWRFYDCRASFQEENAMLRHPMLPPAYWLLSLITMSGCHLLVPVTHLLVFPWNCIGLLPLTLGGMLNLIAARLFTRVGTTSKPYETSTTLVTEGVFRVSRNPMYLGMLLLLLGIAMLLGSLTPYLIVIGFFLLMQEVFIHPEERLLTAQYGAVYLVYQQQVPRWI